MNQTDDSAVALNVIPEVPTKWNRSDRWGAIKVRWGFGRDKYSVPAGLYRVGNPDSKSDVFVTANYKLTFDHLRKNLDSLNGWILVIDTKGINVWCAAGKGTFGTENIIKWVNEVSLHEIVDHRTLILPQLGAVGVAAHKVKELTGFRVLFGPVLAKDIKAFISAGYKADKRMREVNFTFKDRLKLIPVDLMYGKFQLFIAMAVMLVLSGIDKTGFLYHKMLDSGLLPVLNIFAAYATGIVIAPLLLPWIPFRSFALKGAMCALIVILLLSNLIAMPVIENISSGLIFISIASFMTLNFTGSSTFTSLSGVKKEMKWALPFQIGFSAIGVILFIVSRLL